MAVNANSFFEFGLLCVSPDVVMGRSEIFFSIIVVGVEIGSEPPGQRLKEADPSALRDMD